MVNTSKILTVSYGTFSCTLEGFDDSFDMMKAIAEYFRDLAADDRYFGAEPPTPDAEMLARIAEREVSRRVEARQERGAIVLRPSEEEAAPAAAAAPVEPAPQPAPQPVMADPEPEVAQAQPEPQPEPAPQPVIEQAPVATPEAAKAAPQFDEDSVAAKLSRIRAVVSRAPSVEEPIAPAYSEDEHAEDFSGAAAASIAAALREDVQTALPQDEDEDLYDDEQDALFEEEPVSDPQLAEDIAEAEDMPAVEPPLHARVIRMKRADFEAALAEGQLSGEDEEDEDTPAQLSAEDEAELLKELAEVEAELNFDEAPDEDEDDADLRSIFADETPAPAPAAPKPARADTDVGRLMDKARAEMDRPEGAHRRSAIAHLRAAVEATRAETEAGGGLSRGDDSLDAYRDDLNSVVRPRRPRPAVQGDQPATAPRRPMTKPAPLKLVAEQRVDAGAAQPQTVRPRRVSMTDIADDVDDAPVLPEDAASFSEFAEQVGVKDLSELMEAAAAYMSYVEGRQKFSRPQLMNKARQVEDYQFSREDGLRSFGQLLRQGKIEKLKGGRFTVSDDLIGFKPDSRAAG